MIIYIPIKENSQRVPNKNFREFCGKPLWEHTIDKLKDFEVVVDTDSPDIIRKCIDKKWVHSYFRPHHLRGDEVSVVDLIKNFSEKAELNEDDWICQVHVTSPFLKLEHLELLREEIKDCEYDSAFSVDVIQNRFWREEKYGLVPINHNPMKLEQTQDLPKYYMENSYLYLFKVDVLKFGNRIGKNPKVVPIDFPYNLDIDTEQDWNLVKTLENYGTNN
jgi:CMP-N-acetylneuraminic acid synthetase|tara:strand:- start:117 stop:773 length:657 start_codon:yes stop_codon:yes gene_type:complete